MLSRAEVHQRLAAKLSPAAAKRLTDWVRPGYRIQLGTKSPKLPLGASHFAGPADVPTGFVWPAARINKRKKATRPLSLMAQINLAELPASPVDELPRDGWLLFFLDHFDMVWGGYNEPPDCYRTVYIKAGETLVRTLPPGLPEPDPTDPYAISFEPTWTLDAEGARWDLPHPGPEQAKAAMQEVVVPRRFSHQLMGCPDAVQSRPGFGCEPYENIKGFAEPKRFIEVNRPEERDRRWRLLMQFEFNDDLNWRFGDCGNTYFMIRDTDLAAGRFEAAMPEMQCS